VVDQTPVGVAAVEVENVGEPVFSAALDQVVVGQEEVGSESAILVEADGREVGGQDVQVQGFHPVAVVAVVGNAGFRTATAAPFMCCWRGRCNRQVSHQIVQQKRGHSSLPKLLNYA